MSIFSYQVPFMDGHTGDLSAYESKVLLIVNTASECSYSRQFTELQQLYEQYCDQGLEILAFPCNQFNHKEPGSNDEVAQYCRNHFHISFPIFEKIEVTGQSMHPLFRYLVEIAPFKGYDTASEEGRWMDQFVKERHPDLYRGNGIKWNFTKFLIDRTGEVSGRYETTVAPLEMESAIKDLLMRS
ncbi:glutathione peroxidase [Paenibacillus sp. UMB7766-LJ446]|uniref:glutathione peroxidase n=1 Tax=Paenibacillus sp. UMB7766-LJ446 TaxID=3046313 RepID=UPI00254D1FB6|nr:glutathione peroxidase [Paenibacillus sp. UMB7766-LJ446]MDK8190695.1 glutathione peroxidase [Paenibacillus sp. UMB7766-LJ446]